MKKKLAEHEVREVMLTEIDTSDMAAVARLLEHVDAVQYEATQINAWIAKAKADALAFAQENEIPAIQLDGRYWRVMQGHSSKWVATDDDMPDPKPKGAKSLRRIVKGKLAGDKPLWNFITKRVPDDRKIALAISKGYITEKEIGKAFVQTPNAAYLRRFQGEAVDGEGEE